MANNRKQTNSKRVRSSYSQRALSFLFFFFLIFLLIAAGRIVYMQTIKHSELQKLAEQQRLRQKELIPTRGTIYDREGESLAVSVQVYDIIADPTLIDEPEKAASIVASATNGDFEAYKKAFAKQGKKRYSVVERKVGQEQVDEIKRRVSDLPAKTKDEIAFKRSMRTLSYQLNYRRSYPSGASASQVLGFTNFENEGAAGIERYYDKILAGTPGVSFSEVDVAGNPIPSGIQTVIEPTPGDDIMLTIDKDIQFYAESKLEEAVERHQAAAGSVLVMNPKNGEIYAAASYPSFDSNHFNKSKPEEQRLRVVTDAYEPGSTLKAITVAVGLETGSVAPDTLFTVPWQMQVGTRTIKDSSQHATAGWNTSQIIEQSSNVGTTLIANKIGKTKLYQGFVDFGLNEKPAVDFPGVTRGILNSPEKWADVSLSNISFGQGISVSSLQLARSVSAIANGGTLVTPHFLKDIPADPSLVRDWEKKEIISSEAASQTNAILENVMTEGTGKNIKVPGYRVAGKTGTAQKAMPGKGYVPGKYIGSFIGYLPASNPEAVILVMLDEPKAGYYGGVVASQAFSDIASYTMKHLGIKQDAP